MKKISRATVALGLAGVLTLVATPAMADPYSGTDIDFNDVAGTYWEWDVFTDASLDGLWNDAWLNDKDNSTWDQTLWQVGGSDDSYTDLSCADPADLVEETDGDFVVTCDAEDIVTVDGTITATLEFRFYNDMTTVRTRLILENKTASAISGARVWMGYDVYQDSGTSIYASTTSAPSFVDPVAVPSTTTTAADLRFVADDRTDAEGGPVTGYAIGRAGAQVLPTDDASKSMVSGGFGDGNDWTNTYFLVPTLEAGKSIEFVTMAQVYLVTPIYTSLSPWEATTQAMDEAAWANTDIDSDAFVFKGIDDPSLVANWSPAKTPELPNTGVNMAGFGALAGVLLAAGIAVVVIRRRAQA